VIAGSAGAVGDTGTPGVQGATGHVQLGLFIFLFEIQVTFCSAVFMVCFHCVHNVVYL